MATFVEINVIGGTAKATALNLDRVEAASLCNAPEEGSWWLYIKLSSGAEINAVPTDELCKALRLPKPKERGDGVPKPKRYQTQRPVDE